MLRLTHRATMLSTLQKLGIIPSFSRPSVSDDNPYSEAMFRTLKYSPAYPSKPFASLNAARDWVHHFATWYNNEHCHSGIKFVTPAQRHNGEDRIVLSSVTRLIKRLKQPTQHAGKDVRHAIGSMKTKYGLTRKKRRSQSRKT